MPTTHTRFYQNILKLRYLHIFHLFMRFQTLLTYIHVDHIKPFFVFIRKKSYLLITLKSCENKVIILENFYICDALRRTRYEVKNRKFIFFFRASMIEWNLLDKMRPSRASSETASS